MAPSIYHRLRWGKGGKSDVVRVAHRLFLMGTGSLALGLLAAVFLIGDVVFGGIAAWVSTAFVALAVSLTWYVAPLARGHEPRIRREE